MKGHLRHDYNDYTPADFALDESFVKWVKHNDPETDRFWHDWLVANPEKRQDLEAARALVLSLVFKEEEISEEEIMAEWYKLQTRTDREDALSEERMLLVERSGRSGFEKFLRVAAVVLLAVASGFILNKLFFKTVVERVQMVEQSTSKGQKLSVVLPDGTSIMLNSQSTIQYPSVFRDSTREIALEGEAFFDVVHDPARPFKVRTSGITTTVLGTSFNVRAYPDDEDIEVSLVEGKVWVGGLLDSTTSDVILNPSEMITINKQTNRHWVHSFKPIEVAGWKDGILYFNKVSFPEAIARLERWYGVDIIIKPGVKLDGHWRFNGKFHGKTIKDILKVFSYPDLFKYRVNGDSIVIYSGVEKKQQQTE